MSICASFDYTQVEQSAPLEEERSAVRLILQECISVCDKYNFRPEYEYKYIWVHIVWQIQIWIYLGWHFLANTNTNIFGSHFWTRANTNIFGFTKNGQIWTQIRLSGLIFANTNTNIITLKIINRYDNGYKTYTSMQINAYLCHNIRCTVLVCNSLK